MLLSVEIFDVTFPLVKKCRTVSTFFFLFLLLTKLRDGEPEGKYFMKMAAGCISSSICK